MSHKKKSKKDKERAKERKGHGLNKYEAKSLVLRSER